ncbi:MAG: diacylglyceryl transferase [Flavobacteriaceae bacterium]|nr:diacylglyceryl transferase [Flavobacteriaceae bacterium]
MSKLKERWGITSNFQLVIIFIVFGITGSSSVYVGAPILELLSITKENLPDHFLGISLYYFLRIVIIFPIYQILLVAFGFLFGQFKFFWDFEKKMLSRMGIKFEDKS